MGETTAAVSPLRHRMMERHTRISAGRCKTDYSITDLCHLPYAALRDIANRQKRLNQGPKRMTVSNQFPTFRPNPHPIDD